MFLCVPRRAFPVLILFFVLAPSLFAQYSSLPPGEDHPILGSKLQKELGKALEALRANKPADARNHLDAVYRSAPGDADTNFLFGVYSSQLNDWVHARSYWEKVLALSPNHLGALLSLGDALMRESKPNEAAHYLNRAVEVEPTSWRSHAVLADAYLRQGRLEESINQAERALELGHGRAGIVQPLLARALNLHGERGRAIRVLQAYLRENALDAAAAKQLETLQTTLESETEYPSGAESTSPFLAMSGYVQSAEPYYQPQHWYGLATIHGQLEHVLIFPRDVNGEKSAIIVLQSASAPTDIQLDDNGVISSHN